jgi:hypothetical protein
MIWITGEVSTLIAYIGDTTNRELSIKMLTKHDLPLDWSEQETLFLS